jgi:exopolysaccharide biosynthesis protein
VKNRKSINENVENFNYDNMIDFRHPRSAICVDISNNLYFVAIDGRYSDSDGMKMPEIAHLMQNLNCLDAMNLDGGGSTLLYANNRIINHPSDAAGPRKVVSAVLLRDKYKRKLDIASI